MLNFILLWGGISRAREKNLLDFLLSLAMDELRGMGITTETKV